MAFKSSLALMALSARQISAYTGESMGQFVMYTPGGDDTSVQRIDPILFPGSISQHTHQVFGASGLSPDMSYQSLQQSSCTTVADSHDNGNKFDNSVYWHPALYAEAVDGSGYIRIPTNGHKLYYRDAGSPKDKKTSPFGFPPGFRMIAGNPFSRKAATDIHKQNITQWICHTNGKQNQGTDGGFPTGVDNCKDYDGLNGSIDFPHCWNGQDFDPKNPFAHVSYPDGDVLNGVCPDSHKQRIPHIFIENTFDINKVYGKIKKDSFVLAQGDKTGYGWHADFFNGWEEGAIQKILESCPYEKYGNENVGGCPAFQGRSTKSSACKLPTSYNEEVTTPGKNLPGCNPIVSTDPAPKQPAAPLGVATDVCTGFSNTGAAGGSGTTGGDAANKAAAAQPAAAPAENAKAEDKAPATPVQTSKDTPAAKAAAAPTTLATVAASKAAGAGNAAIASPVHTSNDMAPQAAPSAPTAAAAAAPSPGTAVSAASTSAECPAGNGTTFTSHGASFILECGIDRAGGDLSFTGAAQLGDCISNCASTPGCVDVSFMAPYCWLKKSVQNAVPSSNVNGARLLSAGTGDSGSGSQAAAMTTQAVAPTNVAHNNAVAKDAKMETCTKSVTATEYSTKYVKA